MFLACMIFCFLPVLAYAVGIYYLNFPIPPLIFPLLISLLILPMAMLRVAMFETVAALNPMALVKSILTVPTAYACACLILLFVLYLSIAMNVVLHAVPIVGRFASTCFEVYLLVVVARVLGLIYYAYREKLDWFRDIG
jgi:hypothetical protein